MQTISTFFRAHRDKFFSVVFPVVATMLLVIGVTDAATTISTNINTGGTITVTGVGHLQNDLNVYGGDFSLGSGTATTTITSISETLLAITDSIDIYGGKINLGTGAATTTLTTLSATLTSLSGDIDIYGATFNLGTGSATTTLTSAASFLGIASTSPWGFFSVNPDQVLGPSFAVGSSTKTDFIVTNAGLVGIGTTTPSVALGVTGTTTASAGMTIGANGTPANQMLFGSCTLNPGVMQASSTVVVSCTGASGVTPTHKVFITATQLEYGLSLVSASSTAVDAVSVAVNYNGNASTSGIYGQSLDPNTTSVFWMGIK